MYIKFSPIIFVLILLCLTACDPGFSVYIVNKTNDNIKVKALFENRSWNLNTYYDSVCFSDTSFLETTKEEYCIKAIQNSMDGSYNFEVASNKKAMIESGPGLPAKNQKIIINAHDTLSFENKKYLTKGGSFMGKLFIFTIK